MVLTIDDFATYRINWSPKIENIKEFINAVRKEKPNGAKGTYIKKISLSSTMGPGVRIDTGGI